MFPGGILYDNGILLMSHVDEGGISRIETSGSSISTGNVFGVGMDGSSMVRAPPESDFAYAIGRSGETSGVNRVDRLDSTGLIEGGFDELLILPSGDVVEYTSDGSNVWVGWDLKPRFQAALDMLAPNRGISRSKRKRQLGGLV